EGEFEKKGRLENIIVSAKRGQKKVIKRNNKAYERLREHIGFLPTVMISPADRDLIIEGSETRRKFIDGVISQSDMLYLHALINYNRVLSQRNSLLKYFAANQSFDPETIDIYDQQLVEFGSELFKKREAFLDIFIPIFRKRYERISNGKEEVNITYSSQLKERSFPELLRENLQKDRALQYSGAGIHKDDLSFEIEGHPIKKFGSQGQQKSFLISLKLAQFDFIKEESGSTPILLLDDIFDKLDEQRVTHIVDMVATDELGQIFISDTHGDRTEKVVKETGQSFKMFYL
ncbi:MAG TPA: DNA replication and repair protein RecF, partial [Salinimicrobium sp.]|nr:DNA replication and repair protein RecF [Salinimicrobium sp.]